MTVETMRHNIMLMYDTPTWKERVKNMPDNQVKAIFLRSQQSGYLEQRVKITKEERRANKKYHQVTLDELEREW